MLKVTCYYLWPKRTSKKSKNIYRNNYNDIFSEYGVAVAEITAAHNLFIDCKEAENANVKAAARDLIAETNQLHSNYIRINVIKIFLAF